MLCTVNWFVIKPVLSIVCYSGGVGRKVTALHFSILAIAVSFVAEMVGNAVLSRRFQEFQVKY